MCLPGIRTSSAVDASGGFGGSHFVGMIGVFCGGVADRCSLIVFQGGHWHQCI